MNLSKKCILLQPFWKKSGECNYISGKIRMGNDLLCKIEGRWVSHAFVLEYIFLLNINIIKLLRSN